MVERFIREYASAKRRALEHNELMNAGIKAELLRRVDMALRGRERGIITADEAIKMIGGFADSGEDMSRFWTA